MQIGVFGSHTGCSVRAMEIAYKIGQLIAEGKHVLITGASLGISDLAAKGALYMNGLVVEISPEMKRSPTIGTVCHHDNTVLILTGMPYKMRNVISVLSCDICIFISGKYGTLNEFTIAIDNEIPCIVVEESNGISDILRDISNKFPYTTEVQFANTAEEAYSLAVSLIRDKYL